MQLVYGALRNNFILMLQRVLQFVLIWSTNLLFSILSSTVVAAAENVTDLSVISNDWMSFNNHCYFIARKV